MHGAQVRGKRAGSHSTKAGFQEELYCVCVSSQSCVLTVTCVPLELEKTLKRLMFPLGFEGALMLTTAWVEETVWNVGALRPSGGAGPVLHRVQLLAALPAEFTAHTSKRINKTSHNLGTLMLPPPFSSVSGLWPSLLGGYHLGS